MAIRLEVDAELTSTPRWQQQPFDTG